MDVRKIILEEIDDFDWAEESDILSVGSCLETHRGTVWNFSRGRYNVISIGPSTSDEYTFDRLSYVDDIVTLRPIDGGSQSITGEWVTDLRFPLEDVMEKFLVDGSMSFCQGEFVRHNLRGEPIQESNEFDWAEEIPTDLGVGSVLETENGNILTIIRVTDKGGYGQMLHWDGESLDGDVFGGSDYKHTVQTYIESGDWTQRD